ncbi:hypothetical protein ABK040_004315 [Willaertia magna]
MIFNNENFNNLTNLKCLQIKNTSCLSTIEESCFKNLGNLTKLTLQLSFPQIYNYLKNITNINLGNIFDDINLNEILYCLQNLTKLKLQSCRKLIIEDNLQNLSKLKVLYISSTPIFGNLYNMPNVTKLSLRDTNIIDGQIMNLENLEELFISKCYNLTGECFEKFKKLKVLTVFECKHLNFNNVSQHLHALKELYIKGNNLNVKDKDLENLVNIEILNISLCQNVIYGKFLMKMEN